MLLGAAAMQAQSVAHKTSVAKAPTGLDFVQMEAVCGGDVVEATAAERAQAKLKAAPATGAAYYYRPAGTFYVGTAGTTTYSQYAPMLAVGPYKSYTFKAQEADSYDWLFQLGGSSLGNWYGASSQNVKVTYGFEYDSVPSLTVGDTEYHLFGNQSATQTASRYAWVYSVPRPSSAIGSTSAGSYYASPKYIAYRNRDNSGSGMTYYTGSTIGYNGGKGYWFGYNTRGWNGVATYVEEPANPYILNGGAVRYTALAWADSTSNGNVLPITVDVYAVTTHEMDTLALGEKLASATASITMNNGSNGGVLFELDEPLVVDKAIALVASGYVNDVVTDFTLYISKDSWDEGHGQHGYLVALDSEGSPIATRGLKNFFSSTDLGVTAPSILLDVSFPFLTYYYNIDQAQVDFDFEGVCVSDSLGSYAGNEVGIWAADPSSEWTISGEVPNGAPAVMAADGGGVPEWISYEIEDGYNSDGDYNHLSVMKIFAGENTAKQNRSAILVISQPGAEDVTVVVTQTGNPTAISVVDAAKTLESVRYYNLAGVESATPHDGVNIEVKKYSDGTKVTSKVVR